jgi:penicillin-insensitive murein endopeptidase
MKKILLGFCVLVPALAWAIPTPSGYPNKGLLDGGESIFKVIKGHSDILTSVSPAEFQYGTTQMAEAIIAIGNWSKELGRQPVWIGDVSKKGGGQLARHVTHQRGLDVDVAYLVYEHKLSGHRAKKFHDRFTEQFGMQKTLEKNFDLESNYHLLERVVRELHATSIYVGCGIYDALEARDKKNEHSIMDHIYAEKGHEDHFHFRMKCPENAVGCSDEWWRDPSKPRKEKNHKGSAGGKFRDC